ncbi:hypothetical protein MNEG_13099 [Monoraphidium neglectum]|uniref:Uncharacterized protein n=1 Tax=Monoraphidium neglectum TaxID=145388 RepID=A0A0D2J4J3_9CHLO|nr:hypothetical protein MNEG_13099 [Monoraphidium neglectum]KIY94862.1 hypothetical protein MNEG_13099 [Monoraphidium neglectum]|eukprot:XP_013893882.1 hypothetical protein MNEG_13099 [Monoraphidium neglectum]
MTGAPTKLYVLWYGPWTGTQKGYVRDFITGLSGSKSQNINSYYYSAAGLYSPKTMKLMGEADDASRSSGTVLSDSAVMQLVDNRLAATPTALRPFPFDKDAIYIVMSDNGDV